MSSSLKGVKKKKGFFFGLALCSGGPFHQNPFSLNPFKGGRGPPIGTVCRYSCGVFYTAQEPQEQVCVCVMDGHTVNKKVKRYSIDGFGEGMENGVAQVFESIVTSKVSS